MSDVVLGAPPPQPSPVKRGRGQRQLALFEGERLTLEGAVELSLASLKEYGQRYRHWAVAYSGGKDSSATATFVAWAIRTGRVPAPESLTVLYADTGLELPPLQQTALKLLETLRGQGFGGQVVKAAMDDRYFVYMLGRGVPPSRTHFQWCTGQMKVKPMLAALEGLRETTGEKLLMLTGLRLGESAVRDQRIAVSCSRDKGECGQGWFQQMTDGAIADILAPLLHWRLCHVYDWLYFDPEGHGYDISGVAAVYGEEEMRTGCMGCSVASKDTALERLIRQHPAEWGHLRPMLELRALYDELTAPKWRKRKAAPELKADGQYSKNVQRFGPLMMPSRVHGLGKVLDIQRRTGVELISAEEEKRIRELWELNTWPERWSEDDVAGDTPLDAMRRTADNQIVVQSLLL